MGSLSSSAQFQNLYALNTFATLEVSFNQEPDNNRSRIDFKVYIEVRNWSGYSGSQWLASSNASVTGRFNGGAISTPVKAYRVYGDGSGTGKALVSEGSFYHNHDSNGVGGTRNITVSVTPNIQPIANQPTLTMSLDLPLGNIEVDKASTLSGVASTIQSGATTTVTINNPNPSRANSYRHEIIAYINGKTITLGEKTGTGSYTFSVPSSLDSSINAYSVSGMLGVTTYINGYYKDSNFYSTTFISGASLKPTISSSGFSITDSNTQIKGMNLGGYVAGVSAVTVTLNDNAGTFKYGATKAHFNVYLYVDNAIVQTLTASSGSVQFQKLPPSKTDRNGAVKVSVTDSRGATSDIVQVATFKIIGYESPTANGNVARNLNSQTNVNITLNYTMSPLKSGTTVKNPMSITFQKRKNGENWANLSNVNKTGIAASGSTTVVDTNVSTALAFEYRVIVNDTVSSSTVVIGSIGTEKVPLDISRTGIGVGRFHSDGVYDLEVGSGGILSEGNIQGKSIIGESLNLTKTDFNLITTGMLKAGSLVGNNLNINGNGGIINFNGTNHVYMQFNVSGGRKAYIGFPESNSRNFDITNEYAGKTLQLHGGGELWYGGGKVWHDNNIPTNVKPFASASSNIEYRWGGSNNLNDMKQTGFYFVGHSPNAPARGLLVTAKISNTEYIQVVFSVEDGRVYRRITNYENGVWGAWLS